MGVNEYLDICRANWIPLIDKRNSNFVFQTLFSIEQIYVFPRFFLVFSTTFSKFDMCTCIIIGLFVIKLPTLGYLYIMLLSSVCTYMHTMVHT